MPDKVEKLQRKVQNRDNMLRIIEKKIIEHKTETSPLTVDLADVLVEEVSDIQDKLSRFNDEILSYCKTGEEQENHEEFMLPIQNRVLMAKSALRGIQKTLGPIVRAPAPGANVPGTNDIVKLNKIDAPIFEGTHQTWTSFENQFKTSVINNRNLTDSQKLYHLKKSVRGTAEQLLRPILITDANFDIAWKMLESRFDNKRKIVDSHVRKIMSHQVMKVESASSIQQLVDTNREALLSLRTLGVPVDEWDILLVHLTVEKLHPETKLEWGKELKKIPPTYKQLEDFLQERIEGLSAFTTDQKASVRKVSSHHVSSGVCCVCNEDHQIFQCQEFKSLTVDERVKIVQKTDLCMNCFQPGHAAKTCRRSRCKKCRKPHNTLLHYEKRVTSDKQGNETSASPATVTVVPETKSSNSSSVSGPTKVLLMTARCQLINHKGETFPVRVFLDSGSEGTFISSFCASNSFLPKQKTDVIVSGLSATAVGRSRSMVSFKLRSNINNKTVYLSALILPKVTSDMPRFTCESLYEHLKGVELADPEFNVPGRIDILIGSDFLPEILLPQIVCGAPSAQNTIFGHVLFGKVPSPGGGSLASVSNISSNPARVECCDVLERFWKIEEIPEVRHFTKEEAACEKHFVETHTRDKSGRYIVRLPFNHLVNDIGDTRKEPVHRQIQLEKRFKRNPVLKTEYVRFMTKYEQLGHMELVPESELDNKSVYIPHHPVFKPSSTTTKIRVVFDGSAPSSSGVSLNNAMLVGPTVQDDLYSLLLRFRKHPIALSGDIVKMYRQFQVHSEDIDFQRIVWRSDDSLPLKAYRCKTVTYGTGPAPHLATRCANQLAYDEASRFPVASPVLLNDMYVDNIATGTSDIESAIHLQRELCDLASAGGMEFAKWMSNSEEVMSQIPSHLREFKETIFLDDSLTVGTLGLQWKPKSDVFVFSIPSDIPNGRITKRQFLKITARVFDPKGFLSPVTVRAKFMFQMCWTLKLVWDDELPEPLHSKWVDYKSKLHHISELEIPRFISQIDCATEEIHGFSDASELGYSACVYLKSVNCEGHVKVVLITSKTRVAPVQQISLPRLELCGAHLLACLVKSVLKALKGDYRVFAYTDSTIVLSWLRDEPKRWKTFVANRVSKIQEVIPFPYWNHVKSEENPADCASRGVCPSEIGKLLIWWNGPEFLHNANPTLAMCDVDAAALSEEKKTVLSSVSRVKNDFISKFIMSFSSIRKLLFILSMMRRLIHNYFKRKSERRIGVISAAEREESLHFLIRYVQKQSFPIDIKCLMKKLPVPVNSVLSSLSVFCEDGLIKVGGRASLSDLPVTVKHPIVLPTGHWLTKLIIEGCHRDTLHGGFQLVNSTLRQQFWIIRARDNIRHIIRKCVVCKKASAKVAEQMMGNLPVNRVTFNSCFSVCGVDFAGPISVLKTSGRGAKSFNIYFAIFVCFSTKAVHLDWVGGLTSEAFLGCLKRFVSRRGNITHLHSDNGKNFVGCDNNFKAFYNSEQFQQDIASGLAIKGMTWHFNDPKAAHAGGLWESGVKSVKHHLKRVIGNTHLTLEEFATLLCCVEAVLNSRPLCAMSPDPNDLDVLTPGHFLIGRPLISVPEEDLTGRKLSSLNRWQLVTQRFQNFIQRWKVEYQTGLQQRFKWKVQRPNIQVGDLVLLHDDNKVTVGWRMARVMEVSPGKDGLVRSVLVKTSTGELKRPIQKLSLILPCDNESDESDPSQMKQALV